MPETRRFLDPEKRVGLTTLYAKAFGSITTPHTTGTVQGTSVGAGYYDFAALDTGLDYTVQEEAVAGTKAATDEWLAVLSANFAATAVAELGRIPRSATAVNPGEAVEVQRDKIVASENQLREFYTYR